MLVGITEGNFSIIIIIIFNIFVKESKLLTRNIKCTLQRENKLSGGVKKLVN